MATAATPADGEHVYMLHVRAATPFGVGFLAVVRPVESEQSLAFTDPAELLAYLRCNPPAASKDES